MYTRSNASVFSASDPVCSQSTSNVALEGDVVTLSCEVTYRGKWGPRMTWFDRSGAVIASIDSGTPGSVVRHEISVTVVASDEPLSFSCLTDFSDVLDPAPGEHEASNTVDYEHTYTSGDITVHCEYLYGNYVTNKIQSSSHCYVYSAMVGVRSQNIEPSLRECWYF